MLPWWQWPQEFKIKNNKFLKSWIKKKSEEILIKKLIQWHLDEQWSAIKNFAKSSNIKLIGDLPFYVSRDLITEEQYSEFNKRKIRGNNLPKTKINWQNIDLFWGDERYVTQHSNNSNFKSVTP